MLALEILFFNDDYFVSSLTIGTKCPLPWLTSLGLINFRVSSWSNMVDATNMTLIMSHYFCDVNC